MTHLSRFLHAIRLVWIGVLGLTLAACDSSGTDNDLGDWEEVSSFEGDARSNAVAFTLGDRAYVGTGFDGDDPLSDVWEYDADQNFWVQKADFPGPPRSAAVAFTADGNGYVGTGFNSDVQDEYLSDFWRYDPDSNTWVEVAAFGGSARYGAVAFGLDDSGYVGTGYDGSDVKDFWRYDPDGDAWTQVVSLPGDKRSEAVAFTLGGLAYVGTGRSNGTNEVDFWRYDPSDGRWTRLRDLDEDEDDDFQGVARSNAVAFTLGGRAYLTLGRTGSLSEDVWEYDPATDRWEAFASFEGLGRTDAVAFTLDNVGYVGTGAGTSIRFDDVWRFDPTVEQDDD